jgi:penicillin-insensitive murein DD-endopeptidase
VVRVACALLLLAAGCAELGLVTDGTSVSVGKPSNGHLVDAKRLPDSGEGYKTQAIWRARGNRYGTDELLDLITGVGRRMAKQVTDVKLVVADLSSQTGGAARAWHRSHQSGRDADLVYYMRGPDGKPWEADAMRVFDAEAKAKDGSGITVDIPRTWLLVKALVTAPEARVQWVFMFEPIATKLIEHATKIGEPEALIARARKTLKQPGDSARHDDHLHVRVYCSDRDREFGCVDIGPMELYAEREAESKRDGALSTVIATLVGDAAHLGAGAALAATTGAPIGTAAAATTELRSLGQRLRVDASLRIWR